MTLSKDDIQASGCSEQLYLRVGSVLKKKKIIFYIRVEEDVRLYSVAWAPGSADCAPRPQSPPPLAGRDPTQ